MPITAQTFRVENSEAVLLLELRLPASQIVDTTVLPNGKPQHKAKSAGAIQAAVRAALKGIK